MFIKLSIWVWGEFCVCNTKIKRLSLDLVLRAPIPLIFQEDEQLLQKHNLCLYVLGPSACWISQYPMKICQHPWLFPLRTSLNVILLVQVMVVPTTYYYHDFFYMFIEVTSIARTVLFCAALEGPVSLCHAPNRPRQGCIPDYYDAAVGCHTNLWLQYSFKNEESNLILLYIPVYEVVW